MRTAVLAAQVCKYVALFSSKGYAVGAKFREWMLAEAEVLKEEAGGEDDEELLGCIEDLMAICGSRDYVFFMNAAVVERLAQAHSLRSYLEEERDLGGEAGGKLRASILTGFGSEGIMATVRTMALVADAALWPQMRAIGTDEHILDVLPAMWPAVLAFYERAAAEPAAVIDGSLRLEIDGVRPAKDTPRARRAAVDMARIRRAATGDATVERLLTAMFTDMAKSVRTHASEFLPGGICAADAITPELRQRLSGMPMTSTGAERIAAIGRANDKRTGAMRDDTRSGTVLADLDNTHAFMAQRSNGEAEWRKMRRLARRGMRVTLEAQRRAAGLAARTRRDSALASLRAKRAARAAERARVAAIPLATRFSELLPLQNPELADQLKARKAAGGTSFTVTQKNRTAYVLALQALLLAADPAANDLPDGESGVDGRQVKRKARARDKGGAGARGKGGKGGKRVAKRKLPPGTHAWMDYEWTDEEAEGFEVELVAAKVVADGTSAYANQGKVRKGTVLYRIVWKTYSPDLVWYEPAANVSDELIAEFEARVAAEAEAEAAEAAAEAAEEAELAAMDEEDAMPTP